MARAMLNSVDAMLRFSRTSLVVASVSATALVSEAARAQPAPTATATTSVPGAMRAGPSITMTQQANPLRFVNGQQVNQRPPGLTPLGVNYQDCINDMTLQFSVALSGFDGTTNNLQIWATKSGDCTAPSTRGLQGTSENTCWLVNQGLTVPHIEIPQTSQFNVRVQDLVGPQNVPPHGANLVHEDASACKQQPSFAAVPMTVWFMAIDSAGNSNGTPFQYQIRTDLIGPPPPAKITTALGDTLMTVNWTANTDGDTGGYNVFINQAGTQADGAVVSNTQRICPDSGPAIADAAMEAADDASTDDATASIDATASTDAMATADASGSDAGCKSSNVGGNSDPTTSDTVCLVDPVLSGGIVQDGGAPAVLTSDAGTTVVPTGGGGISTIPTSLIVNPNVSTGETVSGQTNSTYMLTGLKNGATYNVVVAAVDNSGNVGPPSFQGCGTPAPVDDFWKIYRQDGGKAGGFCALEAVGSPAGSTLTLVAAGSLVLAAVGRRRRRRAR